MISSVSNKQFLITSFEDATDQWKSLYASERRLYYELFFVTSGNIIREYNLNSIRINKNDFHISLPGQITEIKGHSDDLTGFYCRFESEFLNLIYLKDSLEKELAFINSFIYKYPLRLKGEVAERLEYNFKTINHLSEQPNSNSYLIHTYLVTAIYEIKKLMDESHLNPYPSKAFLITQRYNDLLVQHINRERSIEFYAKRLNVTPNHLNKSIKATTGKTAISLLNEMTALEAKVQLKHSEKQISEIAFQLGFGDQSYFSRFFKKSTGISPADYRKKSGI